MNCIVCFYAINLMPWISIYAIISIWNKLICFSINKYWFLNNSSWNIICCIIFVCTHLTNQSMFSMEIIVKFPECTWLNWLVCTRWLHSKLLNKKKWNQCANWEHTIWRNYTRMMGKWSTVSVVKGPQDSCYSVNSARIGSTVSSYIVILEVISVSPLKKNGSFTLSSHRQLA